MRTKEKLESEAIARAKDIANRFKPDRCVGCGTAGIKSLIPIRFTWRKQVSRSQHSWTRIEYQSDLQLCDPCWLTLRNRRKLWRLFRLLGGFALGGAICGLAGSAAVLWLMRLNSAERTEDISVLIASALLVPCSLFLSWFERSLSVPTQLMDQTGRGWECWKAEQMNASQSHEMLRRSGTGMTGMNDKLGGNAIAH